VPTLVIHATGDLVVPLQSGRALAEGIPGARFVEFDSANHILLEQVPAFERFLAEIRGFVDEAARRAPGATGGWSGVDARRRRITVLDAELVSPVMAIEAFGTRALELAGWSAEGAPRPKSMAVSSSIQASPPVTAAFGALLSSELHAVGRADPGAHDVRGIAGGEHVRREQRENVAATEVAGPGSVANEHGLLDLLDGLARQPAAARKDRPPGCFILR
jgi:hypothetical protein